MDTLETYQIYRCALATLEVYKLPYIVLIKYVLFMVNLHLWDDLIFQMSFPLFSSNIFVSAYCWFVFLMLEMIDLEERIDGVNLVV
jgi:hypothetical protein